MIDNGDFEDGLTGWRVVSGTAFKNQPVLAESIRPETVMLANGPPVVLGGDYWHTSTYPLGHDGFSLIRIDTRKSDGILDSEPFTVSSRFLAYRLGGSADGVALELRIPARTAAAIGRRALDAADDEDYVAVHIATPDGSDVLKERIIRLDGKADKGDLVGATAKIRLRVSATKGRRRLVVDAVRLLDAQPPTFRPPLWGWADIHAHPMAQAGSGDLLPGHIHGPVEDIGSCVSSHGHDHGNPLHPIGFALEEGKHNDGGRDGWPTAGTLGVEDQGFRSWPAFDEITHVKMHQDWIKRAYQGGLRLMVALVVHNQLLASLSTFQRLESAQGDRDAVEPQVRLLRQFVAHNADWCGIAETPERARELIAENKLAFVLGLETDSINGWSNFGDLPNDDTPDSRAAAHEAIHDYFGYLQNLGIVQIGRAHV